MNPILLTRPLSASRRFAAVLAARGIGCVIEPLLMIEPTGTPRPDGAFQAVMITSAQAVEETALNLTDLLKLPCFCVGETTGAAARAAGFTDIRCGSGDSAALAQLIVKTPTDTNSPVLHIAGEITDTKAQEILTQHGFPLHKWSVYRATAACDFTPATRAAFAAGSFAAIPVFSPRSAKILVSLIEKNNLQAACSRLTALGLSQAVTDVLHNLPWQSLRVAATPTEKAVLSCLLAEMS